MTVVDSHLHVWRAAGGETPDVQTLVPPQTDVPIELARATLAERGVAQAVLVQPVFRGEDNAYVANCAAAEPQSFAAVCVVDPGTPGAETRLRYWTSRGCRGLRLRPRIASEAVHFADASTYPLWEAARELATVVNLFSSLEHAPAIDALAGRFAPVPIVIDHLGLPDPALSAIGAAFRSLLELARHPQVFLKLSGFHHFSREQFPFADCWPFVRAAYEHFGPERLLWGSDFPHVVAADSYAHALSLPEQMLRGCSPAELASIKGGNARRLYWDATVQAE
ncbi:MAG TPA: amidohydrolase family protein [Pirellulales bacterium]|nr:amidohydrolase family protein [Pirellulales bacterium]